MDFVATYNTSTIDLSAFTTAPIIAPKVVTVEYQRAVCDVLLMLRHRVKNDGLTITINFKDRPLTVDCSQFDK